MASITDRLRDIFDIDLDLPHSDEPSGNGPTRDRHPGRSRPRAARAVPPVWRLLDSRGGPRAEAADLPCLQAGRTTAEVVRHRGVQTI